MMDPLYQFPLFEGVSDDELRWLIDHSHEETLQDGEYFFRENGPADRFCIVLEGELQVSRTVDGRELIMGTAPRLADLELGSWLELDGSAGRAQCARRA